MTNRRPSSRRAALLGLAPLLAAPTPLAPAPASAPAPPTARPLVAGLAPAAAPASEPPLGLAGWPGRPVGPVGSPAPPAAPARPQGVSVPPRIQYQGRLTDAAGAPVTAAGLKLRFRLYAGPTGGAPLWEEQQTVDVVDGLVDALVGSVSPLSPSLFHAHDALHLGVTFGNDAEAVPRYPLVTVPYAFRAAQATSALSVSGDLDARALRLAGRPALDADGRWLAGAATARLARDGGTWGAVAPAPGRELVALVDLPPGAAPASVTVFGSEPRTTTWELLALDVTTGATRPLGSSTLGAPVAVPPLTDLETLAARVRPAEGQRLHGGLVRANDGRPLARLPPTSFQE